MRISKWFGNLWQVGYIDGELVGFCLFDTFAFWLPFKFEILKDY